MFVGFMTHSYYSLLRVNDMYAYVCMFKEIIACSNGDMINDYFQPSCKWSSLVWNGKGWVIGGPKMLDTEEQKLSGHIRMETEAIS